MASGRLGAADIEANTNTTLYTVPTAKVASVSVNFCNRSAVDVSVRLALSSAATPTDAEWLEYGVVIPASGVLERTGLVLGATQQVNVYASAAGVSAVVYGFEE